MQAQSSREPHHHSHYRSIHRVSNPSYCPSMSTTVPLQHPSVTATPVIIDPEPLSTHVRSVPITSLPNRLLMNSVPMATPTFIQPPPSEVRLRELSFVSMAKGRVLQLNIELDTV